MEKKLTNCMSFLDKTYLGNWDIEDNKDLIVTIKEIEKREVYDIKTKGTKLKAVLVFEEVKPMIVNETNMKSIVAALGTEYVEEWVGKKIALFKANVTVGRDVQPCIRVRKTAPAVTASYKCSVCGKEMDEKAYKATMAKYGYAVCSKECNEKASGGITNV